ncbi:MFS transporter [Umezawaea beigongshangensis]|uniref:MFS transporter n=1 Tax=Umezawaea beigongshangensis TaxID=2780383 RepID=UPI0027DD9156|nr:MFS transporter [Umezawaea beigongshangensis]
MTPGTARVREYRALCWAEVASVAGDQLAKVALSLLVFDRTQSAIWTALTYSMTLLPDLIAGPLLSGLADRYPRREVMALCCVLQAGLVALMVVPGMPLWVVGALVALVAVAQAPFKAAQTASVLDVLGEEDNTAGQARMSTIREVGQLVGLAGGAVLVDRLGTTTALLIDSATFLVAAVLLRVFLAERGVVRGEDHPIGGLATIWGNPLLRTYVWLYCLWGLAILPEAVLIPLAAEIHAPTWSIGLLMAADPLGFTLMLLLVGGSTNSARRRFSASTQQALVGPLAVLVFAPLVLFALTSHVVAIGVLLFVSGMGASYLGLAKGPIVAMVPDQVRGRVSGLVRTGLRASQGVVAATAGLVVELFGSATTAIAVAGACGTLLAIVAALRLRHYSARGGTTAVVAPS